MAGMNATKPLHIFKAGRHTAVSGQALEFSERDLAASAAAYDPAKHEAPIVVGHPRIDAPAYGWVSRLKAGAVGLEAEPHQVDPAFAEMVEAGRFKKISASFFTPDSPSNPVPGVYYLRHVGFLGAVPPAVKGLRTPEFADGEVGIVEFADVGGVINAGLWRRMREFIIAQFGLDKADQAVPDYAVANLEAEARTENETEADDTLPQPAPAFSDPAPQGDAMSVEDKARLESLEAENKQLKADAAARAATERHAGNAAFAESLVKEGRLAPGHRSLITSFLDFASDYNDESIDVLEFAEDGTQSGSRKAAPIDLLKEYLSAQPKLIEFAERAADHSAPVKDVVNFAADDWASQIDAHVAEFKGSTAEAVAAIRAGWRATR